MKFQNFKKKILQVYNKIFKKILNCFFLKKKEKRSESIIENPLEMHINEGNIKYIFYF